MNKTQFMQDGKIFARAVQRPGAGQDVHTYVRTKTPSPVTAQIISTRKKIVQYATGNGFDEALAGTISRMYPRCEAELIFRAIRACSAQGCKNFTGFKSNLYNIARGNGR